MSAEPAVLSPQPSPAGESAALHDAARGTGLPQPATTTGIWPHSCIAVALCLLLALHYETAAAIVGVWLRSATFAHGFMLPPVAAWLIWRRRAHLAAVPRRPWLPALAALAAPGALWLLSTVANVPVLQQYCVVLMLAATIAAILGRRFAVAIGFPLAYLLLAVPFGEVFVPPLIEFTARFTVGLLHLMGIPVFRENNYLSLPTGNWSVVDACSGLRYVIASLALGTLYAYLTYRSLARRLLFIAAALVVPVIANGLRACLIVLIGHWSDMTLAIGIDHLIYGWLFFGLVITLMFWCGAIWRQAEPPASTPTNLPRRDAAAGDFIRATIAALAVIAIWPPLATLVLAPPPANAAPAPDLTLAQPPAPWRTSQLRPEDWTALHAGKPQRLSANYSDGDRTVSLQLTWYQHQFKGSELLTPVRRLAPDTMIHWSEISTAGREIRIGPRAIQVRQSVEQSAGVTLLVWRWYRIGGRDTASPQRVKLALAKAKLLGGDDGGAEIVVAARYDEQTAPAEAAMRDLLAAMLPAIDQGLHHAAPR